MDGELDRTQILSGTLAQEVINVGWGIFRGGREKECCQGYWQRRYHFSGEMDGDGILSWEQRDCQGNWMGTKREISKDGVK